MIDRFFLALLNSSNHIEPPDRHRWAHSMWPSHTVSVITSAFLNTSLQVSHMSRTGTNHHKATFRLCFLYHGRISNVGSRMWIRAYSQANITVFTRPTYNKRGVLWIHSLCFLSLEALCSLHIFKFRTIIVICQNSYCSTLFKLPYFLWYCICMYSVISVQAIAVFTLDRWGQSVIYV